MTHLVSVNFDSPTLAIKKNVKVEIAQNKTNIYIYINKLLRTDPSAEIC